MDEVDMNDCGVFYVATGDSYGRQACVSISTLKEVDDCNITVFCDEKARKHLVDLEGVDLKEIENPEYTWNDKIYGFEHAPYEKSIYLDCDTLILRPFMKDIALALDYQPVMALSAGIGFNDDWETEIYPKAIPQYNTGVVAFRNSDFQRKLAPLWKKMRERYPDSADQPTFRAAAIESDLMVAELPTAYNLMGNGGVCSPVCIYHCLKHKKKMLNKRWREKEMARLKALQIPATMLADLPVIDQRKRLRADNLFRIAFYASVRAILYPFKMVERKIRHSLKRKYKR